MSSRPIFFGREIKNTQFRRSSSPLKVSRNCEICFPLLFLSLLSPWCGSLHTCVSVVRCDWSTPDLLPSDWWRTPCMCWCVYPAGELSVSCVHSPPFLHVIGSRLSCTVPAHNSSKKTSIQIGPFRALLI